jgi:hypothetical protein
MKIFRHSSGVPNPMFLSWLTVAAQVGGGNSCESVLSSQNMSFAHTPKVDVEHRWAYKFGKPLK